MTKILDTARKRIIQFIDSQRIKRSDFLNKTGLKRGVTDKTHQNSGISDLTLTKILDAYPEINPTWLLTGKGDMLLTGVGEVQELKPVHGQQLVPLISKYTYEKFKDYYNQENFVEMLNVINWPNTQEINPKVDRVFEVRGDYMDDASADSFLDGDLVLAKALEKPDWSKLISSKSYFLILDKNNGVILCRIAIYNADDQTIKCHYLNHSYDDFKLKTNNLLVAYKIIDLHRVPRF